MKKTLIAYFTRTGITKKLAEDTAKETGADQLLKEAGADEAAVYPTDGHPVVFGQKIVSSELPTVLVYGS